MLSCLASTLKKCCEMRAISMVAAGTLQGCMPTSIAHQGYPLLPPLGVPFFATAQKEAVALPRSKHIASNVANRYVAWFKYAGLLSLLEE